MTIEAHVRFPRPVTALQAQPCPVCRQRAAVPHGKYCSGACRARASRQKKIARAIEQATALINELMGVRHLVG